MIRPSKRSRILAWLGSDVCFRIIVGVMIFEAAWIAFTAKYPMAFDEEFHFGIIKLYAHHLSPFWQSHPSDGNAFGAVTRDPSYMYHYLMSFVLRFVRLFTDNQTAQIIILRIISIGLFTSSLPLFRKLLVRTGASKAIVHSCLILFIFLPIVPFLAAQINYDNMIMPLVALSLLLTDTVTATMRAKRRIDLKRLVQLILVCLFASLVKYAFLPIFFAIVLFVSYTAIRTFGIGKRLQTATTKSYRLLERSSVIGLAIALVVLGGLLMEREGINVLRYHKPVPDCADVLTIDQCSAYGPWNRDYYLALNKSDDAPTSPATFTKTWFSGMWLRTYFTLAGPTNDYETKGPLTVPAQSAIIFSIAGAGLALVYGRRVFKRYNAPLLRLLLFVSGIYVAFLWFDEYLLFLHAGKAVAINGRYLLLIMPSVLLFLALCYREALQKLPKLAPIAVLGVLVCSVWGGGVMTYMIRSNDSWYWSTTAAKRLNHAAQDVLIPITPGSRKPSQYL